MSETEITIAEREEMERLEILKRYKSLLRSIRHDLSKNKKPVSELPLIWH